MKKIVIVSTYPESGSKNIGDQLITTCLQQAITDKLADVEFNIIWRADSWANVEKAVLEADHVFFACLALRPNMHKNEYPYLEEIVDSQVSFSVIAAGTDLPVSKDANIYEGFSKESVDLLKKVNEKAVVFTTRGVLSQEFCLRLGLDNAVFNGDIAFYNGKLDKLNPVKSIECKKIIVSDPHRAVKYVKPMEALIKEISGIFPDAEIIVAQHGVNKIIDSFCKKNSIKTQRIYEDKYEGLNIYDKADLHVGFRVHAHVSALKRSKFSYLLEQDGRGCDYGATFDKKISVSNFVEQKTPAFSLKNAIKYVIGRPLTYVDKASVSPVYQLLSIIRKDANDGFERFLGVENQILEFSRMNEESIKKALGF